MGVDLDVTEHTHGPFVKHVHAGGSIPHDHLLRAVCCDPRCSDYATHNVHPLPGRVDDPTPDVIVNTSEQTESASEG